MNIKKKNLNLLKENFVYDESMEHDACGVVLVASTEGLTVLGELVTGVGPEDSAGTFGLDAEGEGGAARRDPQRRDGRPVHHLRAHARHGRPARGGAPAAPRGHPGPCPPRRDARGGGELARAPVRRRAVRVCAALEVTGTMCPTRGGETSDFFTKD